MAELQGRRVEKEVLFRGGPILTMAGGERPEAVLVRGSSIAAVGTERHCLEQADDPETVELDGAALLPGFVDAHCHPLMYGQFQTWTDCGWEASPDIESVVTNLSRAGRLVPSTSAVRGHGFNQGNVAERRHLNRHDLDRVDESREVTVFHSSGHGAYTNTWLLRERGIDRETPDPPGGHLGRDEGGAPDGSMWDGASDFLTGSAGVKTGNHGPNFHVDGDMADQVAQLRLAEDHFLAGGVTTVVDAQVTGRELSTYLALRSSRGLRMRVEMLILSSLLDELEHLGLGGRLGDDSLALSGVKLYADGSLTAGTARFDRPYCCDPTDFGFLYHDPAEFQALLSRAHRLGLQAGTHAQGDAAIGMVLDAVAAAQAGSPRSDARHRIEHCGAPTVEQVHRIAELGIHPVTQPQHLYRYGDEIARSIGRERGERFTPLGEFRDHSIPVVLSSDAPVAPPSPLEAIYAAVTRRTLGGDTMGPPEQAVEIMLALRGHTLDAARSIHREKSVGSIEPGKLADLAVLEGDPTEIPVEELRTLAVLETWVGGRKVAVRSGTLAG